VRLDLADDAGGDDLIEAERAADGEHALAFLDWGFASPGAIQRRGEAFGRAAMFTEAMRRPSGIGGNQLGHDFVRAIKLHGQYSELPTTC